MSDRTVHARSRQTEVVRYNRAGKWFLESVIPLPIAHRPVSVREAARHARYLRDTGQGEVFLGRPGGKLFDRLMEERS